MARYAFGTDVARWQGVVGWQSAIDAGASYTWIKVTHGLGGVDPSFKANWLGSRDLMAKVYDPGTDDLVEVPFARGGYLWLTGADSVAQVEACVRAIESVGDDAELPLGIDLEDMGIPYRGAALAEHALKALRRARELTGRLPLLYTGRWFWNLQVGVDVDVSEILDYPLWHSQYPKVRLFDARACGLNPPELLDPTLPEMWVRAGLREAVYQWDGDGGCTLPNGVDVDYNRMLVRTFFQLTGYPCTVPLIPLPGRNDTPLEGRDLRSFLRTLARDD